MIFFPFVCCCCFLCTELYDIHSELKGDKTTTKKKMIFGSVHLALPMRELNWTSIVNERRTTNESILINEIVWLENQKFNLANDLLHRVEPFANSSTASTPFNRMCSEWRSNRLIALIRWLPLFNAKYSIYISSQTSNGTKKKKKWKKMLLWLWRTQNGNTHVPRLSTTSHTLFLWLLDIKTKRSKR